MAAQFSWDPYLQVAKLSDVGMRRSNNQDAFQVALAGDMDSWFERGHLFIVADGMGAHAAGELASKMAADGVSLLYSKYKDLSPPEALQKAIIETNAEVHRRGEENTDFHNMGTTCSAIVLLPQGAVAGHVGDSRIYRLRRGVLEQLTFDHSLDWEMRAAGQTEVNVPKNVITRSLGPRATVEVDVEGPFEVEVGDTFLLCSDGLSGQVNDEEIAALLMHLQPEEAARTLVDVANLRGGPDNTTVIIARVMHPDLTTAQRAADAPPLTIGKKEGNPALLLGTWVVAGVCLLLGLGLMITNIIIGGIVAGIGLVAGLFGLVQQFGGMGGGTMIGGGRLLGKGPYTRTSPGGGGEVIKRLSEMVKELQQTAMQKNWPIDGASIARAVNDANTLASKNQTGQAVKLLAKALSHMMRQLEAGGAAKR